MNLQELGFTQDELQQRVVNTICDRLLKNVYSYPDPESDPFAEGGTVDRTEPTALFKALQVKIKSTVDARIDAIAEQHVLPKVGEFIETLTLQERTKWGEKVGKPMSLIEYMVERCNHYLTEKVDSHGRNQSQGSYHWNASQTRITNMVHEHLHYTIQNAMHEAVKNLNSALVDGIAETVKIKVNEVVANLKIEPNVKVK
jgi:hypothetical protein